jgi:hypothetical protein
MAIRTRNMMMIMLTVSDLVVSGILTEIDTMDNIIFAQYLDRPINGHHVDTRINHLQFVKNIFDAQRILGRGEKLQNPYS